MNVVSVTSLTDFCRAVVKLSVALAVHKILTIDSLIFSVEKRSSCLLVCIIGEACSLDASFLSESVTQISHDKKVKASLWIFSFRWIFWKTSSALQLPDSFRRDEMFGLLSD